MLGLEYRLDGHRFVVEAKRVHAVLPGSYLLPEPGVPGPWRGWLRFRDQLWPVVDMGAWWLQRPTVLRPRSRILVASVPDGAGRDHRAGFLVDCVWGVVRCRPEEFVLREMGRQGWPLVPPVVLDERGMLHWVRWEELWGAGLECCLEIGSARAPRRLQSEHGAHESDRKTSGLLPKGRNGDSPGVATAPVWNLPGCWRTEGSWGSGKCAELDRVRHCTGCEVFQSAARGVLDTLVPSAEPGMFETDSGRPWRAGRSPSVGVMVFALDGEWWAVPARRVAEVTRSLPLHRLPGWRRGAVCGLVQWRGSVLPCVSLRWLQGREEPLVRYGGVAGPWVMIMEREAGSFAWPVDRVVGLVRVGAEQIQEVPVTLSGSIGRATCGMFRHADRWVGLLDWERASTEMEIEWAQNRRRQVGR